jgi:hypothetical protein
VRDKSGEWPFGAQGKLVASGEQAFGKRAPKAGSEPHAYGDARQKKKDC